MKKWLITTLLVIACVFGLVACGSSENPNATPEVELTDEQEQQWFDSASQFVLSMHDAVQSGQAEAQMDDPVYGPAFTSWQNALEDIGEVQNIEGKSTSFTKKEGTVIVTVKGSRHDADVVFTMEGSSDGYKVSGITTNVEYNMSEKIQQAALNTLLGMGTTFAVLILLALVIALFGKVVGGASNRSTQKKSAVETAAAPAPAAVVEEAEELADDMELVAVIAAAIAAYEGQQSTDGFVVRSIRKARRK